MKTHWIGRVISAIGLALLFMIVTSAFVKADAKDVSPPAVDLDCQTCHEELHQDWQEGGHGESSTNPVLAELVCQACHDPINEDHATAPMPANRAAEQCGACHAETYASWRESEHGQVGLTCVGCHDAHATDLMGESGLELCASCHGTRVMSYTHSSHYAQGLTCVECHLPSLGEASENQLDKRDHSFAVDGETCGSCHDQELHSSPVSVAKQSTPVTAVSIGPVESDVVSTKLNPVRPSTYALVSGLIGMIAGMILAPWLERWYSRLRERIEKS